MHRQRILAVTALLTLAASGARAQAPADSLTPLQLSVACALPPATNTGAPADALLVIGAQDTVPRRLYSQRDLLVVNGGSAGGVQLGQQYFVRRREGFPIPYADRSPHAVRTVGWIRIVAVNDTTAIAFVEHACDGILGGDFLDPFVAPVIPPGSDRADTSGTLDFGSLGRVLFGDHERRTGAIGEFIVIDRGADQGVSPGARFAVYRDLGAGELPLAAIGEVTVVSTSPTLAVARINRARDAVRSGDFVVPRK